MLPKKFKPILRVPTYSLELASDHKAQSMYDNENMTLTKYESRAGKHFRPVKHGREVEKNACSQISTQRMLTITNCKRITFINQVEDILKRNYNNSEFGVLELSGEMNLGTRQLQRKFNEYIGFHPNQYIRSYRLDKAAKLLKCGRAVKQAAYDSGFSSVSYFTTTFRQHIGVTPKLYSIEYLSKD